MTVDGAAGDSPDSPDAPDEFHTGGDAEDRLRRVKEAFGDAVGDIIRDPALRSELMRDPELIAAVDKNLEGLRKWISEAAATFRHLTTLASGGAVLTTALADRTSVPWLSPIVLTIFLIVAAFAFLTQLGLLSLPAIWRMYVDDDAFTSKRYFSIAVVGIATLIAAAVAAIVFLVGLYLLGAMTGVLPIG